MKRLLFIPLLLITSLAFATPPTRQSTYTTGTTIRSTDVTSNEDAIFNYLQTGVDTIASNSVTSSTISDGTITNNDVDSSAAIAYSKLNLSSSIVTGDITDGTIVNADISTSASIADTKLAQITTASKVSGTAMTGLSSIVSGAGQIPAANQATKITTYTSDDTFVAPTGVTKVYVSMVGGGGGGKSSSDPANGGGGGSSGAWIMNFPLTVTPGNSYTADVGAGGAADANGSVSTFGSLSVAGGNKGGTTTGGAAVGGWSASTTTAGGYTGQGGAGGDRSGATGGAGGGSPFGAGGASEAAASANTGGGGGGGHGNSGNGFAGGSGVIIVMY